MKKTHKLLCIILTVLVLTSTVCPSVFAKTFAQKVNTNIGVNTQYAYSSNDPSWLRKLKIKEDMLSVEGIATELTLYPVTDYPYTTDAPNFKAQVSDYVELYTLDKDSQRAAYIYVLQQIGALSIISDPTATDKSKADWLRKQGIVITEEEELDPDKILMISALYALMKNNFYYVYTGKHLTIPEGTPLEEAVVMYLIAISGQESTLTEFLLKFFDKVSVGSLEDYIYYTSLMALYTAGYVTPVEVVTISRDEVYRRVAIMTIRKAGFAIDSKTATTEEITQKYLTAMLGTQYSVTLDPTALAKAEKKNIIPYYILQRMAYEDIKLTISQTKYSFEECFNIVLEKTDRFKLENEFYSDIQEYNVYLKANRSNISINPVPISNSGTSVFINSKEVVGNEYSVVELTDEQKQTISIVSRQKTGNKITSTAYKINVYQGTAEPTGSNITGIIGSIGNGSSFTKQDPDSNIANYPSLSPILDNANAAASNLLGGVLTRNDKGQLVDQYGNIVSNQTYETLPEGYKYVLGADGIITIVPIDDSTAAASDSLEEENSEKINKIIFIVSAVVLALLIIAIVVVLIATKGKRSMTQSEKTRARRRKEKAKKAKREARANKKKK